MERGLLKGAISTKETSISRAGEMDPAQGSLTLNFCLKIVHSYSQGADGGKCSFVHIRL
jgi:hypothetical protein